MNGERPKDGERLEEGLRLLRELGYLQTPVERYVARKVPEGAAVWRVALLVGLFVGVGGGLVFALLLTVSAVLSEPSLLERTRELAWLVVDMALALSLVGFLLTSLASGLLLRWFRGEGEEHRGWMTRLAMFAPPLAAGLYLVDRVGTYVLAARTGAEWIGTAIVVVILTAAVAALMTWLQSALFAAARLQWKGVWKPPRMGWQDRALPFLVVAVAGSVLVLIGPYRESQVLPRLDQVAAPAPRTAEPLLLLAVDGVTPDVLPDLVADTLPLPLTRSEAVSHPVAFWNEVATGFESQEHGLQSLAEKQPRGVEAGLPDPGSDPLLATVLRGLLPGMGLGVTRALDQRELQRPQLWEIAAHAGVRSLAVNWWATYPAARHPRLEVLTDRLFLRPDDAEPDPYLMSPPQILSFLQTQRPYDESESAARVSVPDSLVAAVGDTASFAPAWRLARRADRQNLELARTACAEPQRALVVLFLGGADVVARAVEDHPRRERILAAYRQVLRGELEEFLEHVERETWTLLASRVFEQPRRVWAGWGEEVEEVRDLAPAALARMGIAVAADMTGPAGETTVETWGRRPDWSPVAERRASDLERLRSLGYIGGS